MELTLKGPPGITDCLEVRIPRRKVSSSVVKRKHKMKSTHNQVVRLKEENWETTKTRYQSQLDWISILMAKRTKNKYIKVMKL